MRRSRSSTRGGAALRRAGRRRGSRQPAAAAIVLNPAAVAAERGAVRRAFSRRGRQRPHHRARRRGARIAATNDQRRRPEPCCAPARITRWSTASRSAPTGIRPDNLAGAAADPATLTGANPHMVTHAVTVRDRRQQRNHQLDDLGFDRAHPRWVGHVLGRDAGAPRRSSRQPLRDHARRQCDRPRAARCAVRRRAVQTRRAKCDDIALAGGIDGGEPGAEDYRLALGRDCQPRRCLDRRRARAARPSQTSPQAVNAALIAHAEARRAYRIAVLDTPPEQTPGRSARAARQMDSQATRRSTTRG